MRKQKTQKATFGMGCFWGPQVLFDRLPGVIETEVGFMGGDLKNPSYGEVCSGKTGHVEVIRIKFDLEIINYKQLLDLFWKNHNPTTENRQGLDIGTQYRSVIFYHDLEQKRMAEKSKKEMQKKVGKNKVLFERKKKIVTEIRKAGKFFRAEEYHQKYLEKRGKSVC